jgi:CRISPR/Cas system endoribonuclease Cas6 (RAMP superfamily)
MQLGGLLGRLTLSGDRLSDLWPLLWLGQHTHLGKGTSFGLGRYRLLPEG